MASIAAAEFTPSSQRLTAPTILVVEDEELVCRVTCEVLRQSGFEVLHASSAANAKETFAQHGAEIDLLLCDTVLPDQSGVILAKALRKCSPKLGVILCSGYPAEALADEDHVIGTHFLSKPYSAQSLLGKVRTILPLKTDERIALTLPADNVRLAKSA